MKVLLHILKRWFCMLRVGSVQQQSLVPCDHGSWCSGNLDILKNGDFDTLVATASSKNLFSAWVFHVKGSCVFLRDHENGPSSVS